MLKNNGKIPLKKRIFYLKFTYFHIKKIKKKIMKIANIFVQKMTDFS